MVKEEEARAALRAFVSVGGLEAWIADQRREPIPGGVWRVRGRFNGWRFRLEPAPGGRGYRYGDWIEKRQEAAPGGSLSAAMGKEWSTRRSD